jgi:hypothetical protein
MVDSETFADRFIVLTTIIMPADAYRLALDLRGRGFSLARDGAVLVVSPPHQLTRLDVAAIRRWKPHLLAYLGDPDSVFTDRPMTMGIQGGRTA